jgi:hypothetical protein
MLQIDHLPSLPIHPAMLVPFGDYKNSALAEVGIGEMVRLMDSTVVQILYKSVIMINSPIAEALSQMIYGLPMSVVYDAMAGNWKRDIHKDRVLFIVYKIMKDGDGI